MPNMYTHSHTQQIRYKERKYSFAPTKWRYTICFNELPFCGIRVYFYVLLSFFFLVLSSCCCSSCCCCCFILCVFSLCFVFVCIHFAHTSSLFYLLLSFCSCVFFYIIVSHCCCTAQWINFFNSKIRMNVCRMHVQIVWFVHMLCFIFIFVQLSLLFSAYFYFCSTR